MKDICSMCKKSLLPVATATKSIHVDTALHQVSEKNEIITHIVYANIWERCLEDNLKFCKSYGSAYIILNKHSTGKKYVNMTLLMRTVPNLVYC